MRIEFWGGAFSADVPDGWEIEELDSVVEVGPPQAEGAVHFSVYRRTETSDPVPGEASSFVRDFARQHGSCVDPAEREIDGGYVANALFTEATDEGSRRWVVGWRVSYGRGTAFTYNDDGERDDLRTAAMEMFDTLDIAPLGREGREPDPF
ncbi:MAG: hypothetical protein ACXVYM_05490 [Gaiellaceae bacterium]